MRKIMRKSGFNSSYSRQSNLKVALYAIGLAVILGICAIMLQDIQVPVEHVTQDVNVSVE